jgi:predicted Zn-dependent protease
LERAPASLRVLVVNSGEVGAFGWRTGPLVITRGLLESVDDDELAAAVAHEVGHLIGDGHVHAVAALRGCDSSSDAEIRADAVAVNVLSAAGLPESALRRLLEKLSADGRLSASCRDHLRMRIERLTSRSVLNRPAIPNTPLP